MTVIQNIKITIRLQRYDVFSTVAYRKEQIYVNSKL